MSRKTFRTIPGTCPRCGAPNHDSLRICAYCGTVLVEDVLPNSQTEVPDTVVEMPARSLSASRKVSAPPVDTVVEMPGRSLRQEPESEPISVSEPQYSAKKKKSVGFWLFVRWSVLWAVNCAVLVGFTPYDPSKKESFWQLFFFGIFTHLVLTLPSKIGLTGRVLCLLFMLLLMLGFVMMEYPKIDGWILTLITAAAFIFRWRQLIREDRQRG